MNFRIAYKPRARLQTVNQLGQGSGAGKRGLRSKRILPGRKLRVPGVFVPSGTAFIAVICSSAIFPHCQSIVPNSRVMFPNFTRPAPIFKSALPMVQSVFPIFPITVPNFPTIFPNFSGAVPIYPEGFPQFPGHVPQFFSPKSNLQWSYPQPFIKIHRPRPPVELGNRTHAMSRALETARPFMATIFRAAADG